MQIENQSKESSSRWAHRLEIFVKTEQLLQKLTRWRILSGSLFLFCTLVVYHSLFVTTGLSAVWFTLTLVGLVFGLVCFLPLYVWTKQIRKHRNKLSGLFYAQNHEVEVSENELRLINRGNYQVVASHSLVSNEGLKQLSQPLSNRAKGGLFLIFLGIILLLITLPMDAASQLVVAFTLLALANFSSQVAVSYHQNRAFYRVLALMLGVGIGLRYIFWRGAYTLGADDLISLFAILLLFGAELYTTLTYVIGCIVNVMPFTRPELSLADVDYDSLPTVDVMIPSYNEDAEMLENTMRAALMMDYPKHKLNVHLLDDGGTDQKINQADPLQAKQALERRHQLQALCAQLGANYHTREKNLHAKAGNINSAFQNTSGDLVVILDADHIPTTDFLSRTVPWMVKDDKVFLVQTPHFMANPDAVERNYFAAFTRMPQETDMFYGAIQKGMDFWSASFFCGSAALIRRRHLAELGGISMDTITEDAETAIRLHAKGYKSVYVSRTMVSGAAAETTDAFITQRTRWAQGMTQILLLKGNLLFKSLAWHQTVGYLSSILFWLFPFARLTFLFMPLAYLVFGLNIYNASVLDIFAFTIPHVIATYMISNMLFGRQRWPLVSEIYEMLQCAFTFRALIKVFISPRSPSFIVTPKGENLDKDFVSPMSDVFYWMLFATLGAFTMGLHKFLADPLNWELTLIVMIWNTLNLIMLVGILNVLIEKRQFRQQARIPANDDVSIQTKDGTLSWQGHMIDMSLGGAQIKIKGHVNDIPDEVELVCWSDLKQDVFTLPVKVLRRNGYHHSIGLQFVVGDEETKNLVIQFTMGNSERWKAFQRRRTRPIPYFYGVRHVLSISLRPIFNHIWLQIKTFIQKNTLQKETT